MLSERRERILRYIIHEYITSATPVGSEAIVRKYALGLSPATIRNEMVYLEGEGYLTHPHTSAGRIPAEKGYRHYVATAPEEPLSAAEQEALRRQLLAAARDIEEWVRLAAALLAHAAQNVALVTPPQATEPRFRHLELVPLHDLVVLLLLVLHGARVRRQVLTLDEPVPREHLTALTNRLNAALRDLTATQISAGLVHFTPLEAGVARAIVELLRAEEARQRQEAYLEGLRNLLAQPEFTGNRRALALLEILEDHRARSDLIARIGTGEALRVAIGSDNRAIGIEDCSVVLMRYGVPGEIAGTLVVLGPTRMAYPRIMATVRYLSELMTDLVREQHVM
ncbi:MAG: heat-inducible transcription repressor HrcA [Chloroflexi bacterium]|nr:heat-inducible transcription repressor HrcA [Chloroflexota bacterium]